MRCSKCGNMLSADEVFCGQCGTPVTLSSPQSTSSPQQPPAHPGQPYMSSPFQDRSSHASQETQAYTNSPAYPPSQAHYGTPAQPSGLYHDATEAIQFTPGSHLSQYSPAHSQPSQGPAGPFPDPYARPATSYAPSPYSGPAYPRQPVQRPKSNNVALVVICTVLALALIGVGGVLIATLSGNRQPATPATVKESTPTSVPEMTPSPTAEEPTPTPTVEMTPTQMATPAPDPGFNWCTTECAIYGFSEQFPATWGLSPLTTAAGLQFANPAQPDQLVSIKALGPASTTADVLLITETQQYASKPGYQAPTTTKAATIGGVTWTSADISFQNEAQQVEQVTIYTTVHEGKMFVISLQAPASQFAQVYTSYFSPMITRFQFI